MAGENLLALLGSNDLAQFNNTISQSNPYGMVGQSLAAWQPDMSTWSPGTSAATAFGKAFLSGLLQNYAQNDTNSQLASVISSLPSLSSDPMSTQVPEGVNPGAFNMLRGNAYLNKIQSENSQTSKLNELLTKVKMAGLTKQAEVEGEAAGKKNVYGDLAEDPESPQYKMSQDKMQKADSLRKELAGNKEILEFSDIKNRIEVLQKALQDPTSVSDLDFIYGAAKVLDPGSVVRESEGQTIIDSNSIPGSTLGYLNKAIKGESAINRKSIYDLVSRHYDTRKDRVGTILDNYTNLANKRGVPPLEVLPFTKESLTLKTPDLLKTPIQELEDIKAQLSTQQLSSVEKAKLVNRAREIATTLSNVQSKGASGKF